MKFVFLFLLMFSFPAFGTEEPAPIKIPAPELSSLKHTKSGRVDKVIDGLTVLLKDKTIVRLSSLDIPDFNIWRDAPHSDRALALLEEYLPEDTEVMLYQTVKAKKGRLNRMRHELAHIVTKSTKEREEIWINGALLAHGIARVMIVFGSPEMFEHMFNVEQEARKAKHGIWSDESEHNVLPPEKAGDAMGEFAVIEGRVEKTASIRNNVYLNFGKDWKTDFTIMIDPSVRKRLAHHDVHPLSLGGEAVRIRGWLREYNGPLIELEIPEHLEVIKITDEQES